MGLTGKCAVVTGASRGIGRAIALELANQGANVVVNYSGSEQKAMQVVEEIKANGGEAIAVQANVPIRIRTTINENRDRHIWFIRYFSEQCRNYAG